MPPKRGRKPLDGALKVLKAAGPVDTGAHEAPEIPPCIRADDVAMEEWDRMVADLAKLGRLNLADGRLLGLYCAAYSRWRKVSKEMANEGATINTNLGGVKANPGLAAEDKLLKFMKECLSEFGMTPNGRKAQGIAPAAAPQGDDLDQFKRERGVS